MMTAMIKPPDSNSNFDDSASPQSPCSTSNAKINSQHSTTKSTRFKPNIRSKLLSLKNKNIMQRSPPTKPSSNFKILPPYPIFTTPQLAERCSLPLPNYSLHTNPRNIFRPHHSHFSSLSSPPYFHNSPSAEDTVFDNSSNDSPIHNV